jgi:hypothetical protein
VSEQRIDCESIHLGCDHPLLLLPMAGNPSAQFHPHMRLLLRCLVSTRPGRAGWPRDRRLQTKVFVHRIPSRPSGDARPRGPKRSNSHCPARRTRASRPAETGASTHRSQPQNDPQPETFRAISRKFREPDLRIERLRPGVVRTGMTQKFF